MLLRREVLNHRLGGAVDLPLLVPSFSSKGFPFFSEKTTASEGRAAKSTGTTKGSNQPKRSVARHVRREYSQTARALEWTGDWLHESLLVSAYDLFHGHLRNPEQFFKNKSMVFIDSGGYELAPDFDSTEPKQLAHSAKPFSADDYLHVLAQLRKTPGDSPFVIANYDWGTKQQPIEKQIRAAQELFNRFPDWLSNFIIKPHARTGRVLDIDEIVRHVAKLRAFDIVGVTEKELGKNLIDKLRSIARLRSAMNSANVNAPIHVWGGLDPVITPLYFFAGAEIFDGVSWLRYTYHNGTAVNRICHGILSHHGLETPLDHMILLCMNDNVTALQRLATNLREFVDSDGSSFKVFEHNADVFERAYRTMCTMIGEMKGGR